MTVSFDAWLEGFVQPTTHTLEVVAPRVQLVLEPVSPRLKQELQHPNRTATLEGLRYSPDGRRIIAGDYPGGVIQVWDSASGKQLTTIETGYGYRGSADYFHLTPDWKTVYVSRDNRTVRRIERDGKKLNEWKFDGDVRAWDIDTGEQTARFQHAPPHGIHAMALAPNGSAFVTAERLPGASESGAPMAASLWDVRTHTERSLGRGLSGHGVFSSDSNIVALSEYRENIYLPVIKLFDVASGSQVRAISSEPLSHIIPMSFDPAGGTLIAIVQIYAKKGDWSELQCYLKFWDVTTGEEVGSIPSGAKNEAFSEVVTGPDGRRLALSNSRGPDAKLYVIDVDRRRLDYVVTLGDKSLIVRRPAFSPDGRWIAVTTQDIPQDVDLRNPAAEDVPQPRIHLIEAATGEVRESLIALQGFATRACFSPDGKTLATTGHGRVLLWDLSVPPGGAIPPSAP